MSIPSQSPYNLSFTAASLRPELCRIIAESYPSGVRLERELRQRLQTLTTNQLTLLAQSLAEDRAAIAWLAMLKYNGLAFELASELLREKLEVHDAVLRPSDYEAFIDARSTGHPELSGLAESTRVKVKRVLLRTLTEAGILVPGTGLGNIQRPVLSPAAAHTIQADEAVWLAGFLGPDAEFALL
jgi:hypothetical protein